MAKSGWHRQTKVVLAQSNCIWQRQIKGSLLWIHAFLTGTSGYTARCFEVQHYIASSHTVEMIFDACAWGLGGILIINGCIEAYFASPISPEDVEIFNIVKGSSVDQQLCEALCMLVGLRLWASKWQNRRSTLLVKGDSVTALTMVWHCRVATGRRNIVA